MNRLEKLCDLSTSVKYEDLLQSYLGIIKLVPLWLYESFAAFIIKLDRWRWADADLLVGLWGSSTSAKYGDPP